MFSKKHDLQIVGRALLFCIKSAFYPLISWIIHQVILKISIEYRGKSKKIIQYVVVDKILFRLYGIDFSACL